MYMENIQNNIKSQNIIQIKLYKTLYNDILYNILYIILKKRAIFFYVGCSIFTE